jgi:hypothetical protein
MMSQTVFDAIAHKIVLPMAAEDRAYLVKDHIDRARFFVREAKLGSFVDLSKKGGLLTFCVLANVTTGRYHAEKFVFGAENTLGFGWQIEQGSSGAVRVNASLVLDIHHVFEAVFGAENTLGFGRQIEGRLSGAVCVDASLAPYIDHVFEAVFGAENGLGFGRQIEGGPFGAVCVNASLVLDVDHVF